MKCQVWLLGLLFVLVCTSGAAAQVIVGGGCNGGAPQGFYQPQAFAPSYGYPQAPQFYAAPSYAPYGYQSTRSFGAGVNVLGRPIVNAYVQRTNDSVHWPSPVNGLPFQGQRFYAPQLGYGGGY